MINFTFPYDSMSYINSLKIECYNMEIQRIKQITIIKSRDEIEEPLVLYIPCETRKSEKSSSKG